MFYLKMSRINTLFRLIPDCVRQYLPCHYKEILTHPILRFPVESLIFREQIVNSVQFFDTIGNPESIVVLHNDVIVCGYFGTIIQKEKEFINDAMSIRNMCIVDNKLVVFPEGTHIYLDNQKMDIEYDWIKVRCVCSIPGGFVMVSTAPVEVDFDSDLPGMIMFYKDGKYDHMTLTPHTWITITWIGEDDIAFAASRITYGIAEIYLLSIDGEILQKLSKLIPDDMLMGLSVLYNPRWEEYILSGENEIIALSSRGSRSIFSNKEKENKNDPYYIQGLCWNDNILLGCLRKQNKLIELNMD